MAVNKQLSLALLVCLAAVALGQDRTYDNLHKATLNENRKTIDAQFGGSGDARADSAQMAVLRDSVNLMLKNHQSRLRAQADGNVAVAGNNDGQVQAQKVTDTAVQAVDGKGQKVNAASNDGRAMAMQGRNRAKADLVKEGEVVRGGTAQQGANNAQLQNEMVNGQKVAKMNANQKYVADAAAVTRDQFNVKTANKEESASRGQYALKADSTSEASGDGTVNAANSEGRGQYNYKYNQDSNGQGQAELNQLDAGSGVLQRRTTGWKCNAVKDGESTCLDANGKIVGKVMTNANGDATVVDSNGVVIGRGKAKKVTDEKYEVTVSEGLAVARTERLTEYDCYNEVIPGGSQEHKVIIENVKVKVDGEEVDAQGGQSFAWPTCFDIEAEVTIPEGVDPSRLAFEYLGHVMPLGNMKCMDSMTCGRGCYYCNACDKERLLNPDARLTTGETESPVCDIHGGSGKQSVSMRVCPPEEIEKYAFCGGFDRHIVGNNYYDYDGSINAQLRVWLRPENEETIRENFFKATTNPLTGAGFRELLITQYRAKVLSTGSLTVPTDNELLEFYVRREGEEKLMACRKGVIDYQIGGSNVDSNIMIDAFSNLPGKNVQLFSDAPCDEWKTQQQKEYDAYLKEYQSTQTSGTAGGSLLSLLQNRFLGNGIRRSRL